jgi:uncharacterized repeat protein (TIGR01451 family)
MAALGNTNKAVNALNGAPASGLTVSVAGTNLSATTNAAGYFQIAGVPSGTVRLQFRRTDVDASADLANVTGQQLVEIEVQVSGSAATIVTDNRSETKVSLCHRSDGVGYHLITISENAEPAHRAHGDAKVGERVPAEPTKTFGENCRIQGPSVEIEKLTNGEDADTAPGPSIAVGSPVVWEYRVTNTGTVALTNVVVSDDRGVSVSCPSTTLAVGATMTCTGSGVAVLGQYRNVGTVNASFTGGTVSDSDPSHYRGVSPSDDDGPKVELCHRTGNGSYHQISVSVSAEPAHRAHGDGKVGEPVPGQAGRVFGPGCSVR